MATIVRFLLRNDCVESALRSSGENLPTQRKKSVSRYLKQKQKEGGVAFGVLFQRNFPLSSFLRTTTRTHTRKLANALLFRASHGDDDEGDDKNCVRNRDARSLRFLE